MTTNDSPSNGRRACSCGVQGPHYPCWIADFAEAEAKRICRVLRVPYTPDADPQDYEMEGGVTAALIEQEVEARTYTAADFERAKFARHPDGRVAVRWGQQAATHAPWDDGSRIREDADMPALGWEPVAETMPDWGALTTHLIKRHEVEQERNTAVARAEKAEQERDNAAKALERKAAAYEQLQELGRTLEGKALEFRAERDESRVELQERTEERDKALQDRDVLAERVRDFADSIRQEQETNDRLRAERSRPLTADDITDEMVERGRARYVQEVGEGHAGLIREVLAAALTEPPPRPEGAEIMEADLRGSGVELDMDPDDGDPYVYLSDYLVEVGYQRGVRVPGSES